MKNIFLDIQNKLSNITELKYIDKNWGQLLYEQPPVKFPCALLDIANVNYTQLGQLAQTAMGDIEITVANLQLSPSSHKSLQRNNAYAIMDIMDKIHQDLHGWATANFIPLIRTNLQKVEVSKSYEIYKITYNTSWRVYKQQNTVEVQTNPVVSVEVLNINH